MSNAAATETDRFASIRHAAKDIKPGATLFYKGAYRLVEKNTARKGGARDLLLQGMGWPVRVPASAKLPVFFGC